MTEARAPYGDPRPTDRLTDAELAEMLTVVDADCLCVQCGNVVDEEADHAEDSPLARLVTEVRRLRAGMR